MQIAYFCGQSTSSPDSRKAVVNARLHSAVGSSSDCRSRNCNFKLDLSHITFLIIFIIVFFFPLIQELCSCGIVCAQVLVFLLGSNHLKKKKKKKKSGSLFCLKKKKARTKVNAVIPFVKKVKVNKKTGSRRRRKKKFQTGKHAFVEK